MDGALAWDLLIDNLLSSSYSYMYGALNSMILRFWPPLSINVKVTYTY